MMSTRAKNEEIDDGLFETTELKHTVREGQGRLASQVASLESRRNALGISTERKGGR